MIGLNLDEREMNGSLGAAEWVMTHRSDQQANQILTSVTTLNNSVLNYHDNMGLLQVKQRDPEVSAYLESSKASK